MKRLKDLREDNDLTQSQLAQIIMQSKSTISKYENGQIEPNIQTIIALAKYFNVTTDYLLGISDIKNPYICPMPGIDKAIEQAEELCSTLQSLKNEK